MYIENMASGCTHKEALFASLDDLDNIYILFDKHNDLPEEIAHLFNEVSILFSSLKKKKHNQTGSKYTQNMHHNTGYPQAISSVFFSLATAWFRLEAQFSQLIKSELYSINNL